MNITLFRYLISPHNWGGFLGSTKLGTLVSNIREEKLHFRNAYRIQGGELSGGQDSVFVCCFNPTKTGKSGQVYCEK